MKRSLLTITALSGVLLSGLIQPALADAETEALRQEIKVLAARIAELEKREKNAKDVANLEPAAGAKSNIKSNSNVNQRLAIVERKQELAEEDAKSKAEKNPTVEIGKKGLAITSPDKQFAFKVNGYAQLDNRSFIHGAKGDDEFLARRLRPIITMQAYKDFSLRLMPDFAGSSTRIFDAHADYRYADWLQFRLGKFKTPVGLERLQSAADVMFAERGHPTNLAPTRDFGFMVYGEPIPELEYQLGVFNGNADLGNTDGDDDNHKDIAARIFTLPFKTSNTLALQNLGVGIGSSYGKRGGTTSTTLLPEYKTPGQSTFFRYNTSVFAEGEHWRVYPQAYYYYNSLGVIAEYAISSEDVRLANNKRNFRHNAWQLAASYVLTGEDASFKGPVKPEKDFNPGKSGWGAFELAARVGETDIDNAVFPTFANIATSASRARSYGTGVNWYLNENVKLVLDYDFTVFDGGAASNASRTNEHVLISRAQFRF